MNIRFNILAICTLIFGLGQISVAATPAGSVIRNQAEATYFDPASDRSFSVTSTIATVRVSSAPNFMFLNDNAIEASPDETIAFPHVLTNTGNEADQYDLKVSELQSSISLLDRAIHIDRNENGALDPDEPAISTTDSLEPGQSIALLLCGKIPSLAIAGQDYGSRIAATSVSNPDNVQTREDIATIKVNTPFRITKSSFPPCATPVKPGGTIDYDIDMVNLGELQPYVEHVEINGVTHTGFVIEDVIPANTTLISNSAKRSSPTQSVLVVKKTNSIIKKFSRYENYQEGDLIQSIGLFIPLSEMRKDQSGRFSFQVKINEDMTPGTVVSNSIYVDLDGDGLSDVSSNQTCNSIAPGGRGLEAQLRFLEPSETIRAQISNIASSKGSTLQSPGLISAPRHPVDRDYADAPVYRLDKFPGYLLSRDGVYLEVRSNTLNTQSHLSDSVYEADLIRVKVQSQRTGDSLYIRLLETGENTGLFRAETPFRLSDVESGQGRDCGPSSLEQCVLRSQSGDRLQATIHDPGVKLTLQDFAVVDPLGIVFDSTSLKPVKGAKVYLRKDDNRPAINPDTGAALESQVTSENGEYFIPRLESGMYHIFVDPPKDYVFPSIVSPTVFAGRRSVDDRSYGVTGFQGVAKSGLFHSSFNGAAPILDIPLDPNLKLGQVTLDKVADRETVSLGDTLTYNLETKNSTDAVLLDVKIVDIPPAGFRYVDMSAQLNDVPLTIKRGPVARGITFPIGRLEIGETAKITYQLQVGPDARPGKATNVAVTTGRTGGLVPAQSFAARETVEVADEGLLSDRAYILGSVWGDINENGRRDKSEIGLPGVRIWLDDGTWVETDELGRYSLYGLRPKLRVARLDRQTLPANVRPIDLDTRQVGKGYSRFVDLVSGELHRVDFPLICEKECVSGSSFEKEALSRAALLSPNAMLDQALAYEGLLGETVSRDLANLREQAGSDGDISSGRFGTVAVNAPKSVKEMMLPEGVIESANAPYVDLDPESIAKNLPIRNFSIGEWVWPYQDEHKSVYARDGRFIAVIKSGLRPTLFVDDIAVDESQLGALIENSKYNATVAAWYGVDLEPGLHKIQVRAEDMFGNERVLASIDVIRSGAASKLDIQIPKRRINADGRSQATLVLNAMDQNNALASGTEFITLIAERPGDPMPVTFVGRDVQPDEPGFQVRVRDGQAKVQLRAPEKAGDVKVTASNDGDLVAEVNVTFDAPLRSMIAVGLLEVGGDVYDLGGDLDPANPDEYPTQMDVDGRATVFLKGRIKGDALLTFSYDSQKVREDGLFRDIDPEAYYPVYGDGSEKGFEAQSRSKIYIRVEKNDSSLMWGDYRSDAFGDDSLIRMRRSLTGANAVLKSGPATLQVFGAEARNLLRSERIRGKGTALDFVLPGAPLVTNSEILTLEVRAKDNPGLLVSEQTLVRFVDYILDDHTGRLTLKAPIASIDEQGNSVFLLANYETQEEAKAGVVGGIRAKLETKNGQIWAGANFDEAGQNFDRKISASVGIERQFKSMRVWAEAGHMQSDDLSGGSASGDAVRVGLEGTVLKGQLTAEFSQADKDFENSDAPIFAGRREARADYNKNVSSNIELTTNATYSQDMDVSSERITAQALVKTKIDKWTLSAGPRFTHDDNQTVYTQYSSAVLRIQRPLSLFNLPANFNVEVEQVIGEDRTRVQVGGDVLLHGDTRLYANHRIIDDLPEQTFLQGLLQAQNNLGQSKTVFGLETNILPNTDAYGEWRIGNALDTRSGEAAYGMRAQWDISEGLSFAPQVEFVNVFNTGGQANATLQNSKAISLALADRRKENARRTLRFEGRKTETSTYLGMRAAWAQRLSPVLTGALKLDLAHDDIVNAPNNDRRRLTLGLARRPLQFDKSDIFLLYQNLEEKQALEKRNVHIISAHTNHELHKDWTLSARAVSKWETAYDRNSSAQIFGGRVIRDLGERWDVELRASQKMINWTDASELSLGTAASWSPKDNLRLTLGYNFTGFNDEDLDPKGYDAQGIYWRLSIAIDESWFGWLTPEN